MTDAASPDLMRAWARIVRAKQTLEAEIENDLALAGALPLSWYDVLLELDRAPQGRLTPRELQQQMLIAQYNLSRLLDRLARKGLVRRVDYPGDRRRQMIRITDLGRRRRAETWPVYSAAVERHAGGRLSKGDLQLLLEILERLLLTPKETPVGRPA